VRSAPDDCTPCRGASQYSFDPASTTCDVCPPNADCTTSNGSVTRTTVVPGCAPPDVPVGAILVPLPGYWHSSPRSPQIHACPFPPACSRASNTANNAGVRAGVEAYQHGLVQNNVPLGSMDLAEYNAFLCQPGHSGRHGRISTSARQGDTPVGALTCHIGACDVLDLD
jgi:hypothetical protein